MSGIQTGRHIMMVASLCLFLGVGVYLAPDQFDSPLWSGMERFFPYFSALMTAGGVLLVLQARFPLSRWVRRSLFILPVAALGWLSAHFILQGSLPAGAAVGLLAAGTVVAGWLPAEAAYANHGPDLSLAVMGLIDLAFGLPMLLSPWLFQDYPYEALQGKLTLMGLSGLLGGSFLLAQLVTGSPATRFRRLWYLPGLIFPFLFGAALLPTEPLTGGIIWGATAILFAASGRIRPLAQDASPQGAEQALEPLLEMLSWILVLAVIAASPLGEEAIHRRDGNLFVLAVLAYNTILPWALRTTIPMRWRLRSHMLFYPLALGVLLVHPGVVAPFNFAALMIMPIAVAISLGRTSGLWQLGIILAVLGLSRVSEHFHHQSTLAETLLEAGFQAGALLAISGFGVFLAAAQGRLTQELRRRKAELKASEAQFRSAFEHAPIGVALVTLDGRWLMVNRALCEMLGYSEAEMVGAEIDAFRPPEDAEAARARREKVIRGDGPLQDLEIRYVHRDGHLLWVLNNVALVHDGHGQPAHAIFQLVDITERKRAEQALAHAADHDSLTDLYNRRAFNRDLARALGREGARGALLLLDLDQFKYVNDSLGHQAGDELLKSLSYLLGGLIAGRGTLARLGGDEFAILLPGAGPAEAEAFAGEVVERIGSHTMVLRGQPVYCTTSLGLVLYPEHALTVEDLSALADIAMYKAKEGGRNRFYLWRPGPEGENRESRIAWERRIRSALEEDRFCLYAQPIMDLALGRTTRHELLVRMVEQDGSILPPGAFLPQAERLGLIGAIDRWVIARAIETIAEMERHGIALPLEVNLSGSAVTDPGLLAFVQRHLDQSGINPGHLIVEITETSAIFDMHQARKFVETLKALGCQFAIDDFGAGFSSFNYLKQLAVDYLKIDGSLVQGLGGDPVNQQLVRSIADMTHGLGKRTVAEYVEDQETLDLLRSYGVDFAQGYHIGRPQPLEAALMPTVRQTGT